MGRIRIKVRISVRIMIRIRDRIRVRDGGKELGLVIRVRAYIEDGVKNNKIWKRVWFSTHEIVTGNNACDALFICLGYLF